MARLPFVECTDVKTGRRVPRSGEYVDQFGSVSRHRAGTPFPPCHGRLRKRECAYRTLIRPTAAKPTGW